MSIRGRKEDSNAAERKSQKAVGKRKGADEGLCLGEPLSPRLGRLLYTLEAERNWWRMERKMKMNLEMKG